jgi:capsid protein
LLLARDIADYGSTELLKQKLAACFAGFITDSNPDSDEEGDDLTETIEPGLIQRLGAGQEMNFTDPPKVVGFSDFMAYNLRALAAAWGITYEALTGNLTDVNFSSGRMGWLEFQRNIGNWRWNIVIPQMLDPIGVWYRQLSRVNTTGRIPTSMIWTPPRRDMINPKEEIQYLKEAVLAGFMSLSEVQRSFGYIPKQLLEELAEDLKVARGLGLALSTDGQMDVGRLQARVFAQQQKSPGGQGSSPGEDPPADPDSDPAA